MIFGVDLFSFMLCDEAIFSTSRCPCALGLRAGVTVASAEASLRVNKTPFSLQNLDSDKEKDLERQARMEASLREREREVQKARFEQSKEIDREREQHKREEAIQNFKALMSDMVRRNEARGSMFTTVTSERLSIGHICHVTSAITRPFHKSSARSNRS